MQLQTPRSHSLTCDFLYDRLSGNLFEYILDDFFFIEKGVRYGPLISIINQKNV